MGRPRIYDDENRARRRKESRAKWVANNPERNAEAKRRWFEKNPGYRTEWMRRKRAKKKIPDDPAVRNLVRSELVDERSVLKVETGAASIATTERHPMSPAVTLEGMMPELEPFEDDPFIEEMIMLAESDEDEAGRLVEEADENRGHGGGMLEAYRAQRAAREFAKVQMLANSDEGQKLFGRLK